MHWCTYYKTTCQRVIQILFPAQICWQRAPLSITRYNFVYICKYLCTYYVLKIVLPLPNRYLLIYLNNNLCIKICKLIHIPNRLTSDDNSITDWQYMHIRTLAEYQYQLHTTPSRHLSSDVANCICPLKRTGVINRAD